jgi:hypothetical protein
VLRAARCTPKRLQRRHGFAIVTNEQFPEDDQRLYDAIFRYMIETGQLDAIPGVSVSDRDTFAMAETAHATVSVPTPTIVTASAVAEVIATTEATATVIHPIPDIVTSERVEGAQSRLARFGEGAVFWLVIDQGGQWLLNHDALAFLLEVARQLRSNG